jgi:YegS/Rv2252/BmrU family lipid kinase
LTVFIVNPAAGGGRSGRVWARLEGAARTSCASPRVCFTSERGAAIAIARQAATDGAQLVVAVGGDGTVNEVVNGLMRAPDGARRSVALGVLATGTGRDLARSLDLPADPIGQLARITGGIDRRIDVGRVTFGGPAAGEPRYFVNVASFGLSGVADRIMNGHALRWLPTKLAFQAAVVRSLTVFRNAKVRIRVDEADWQEVTLKVGAVCNGRHFGGGMQIAPLASLDDQQLDVIIIGDMSAAMLARKFTTVYRGAHLELPEVSFTRGRRIVAEPTGSADVPLDIDGEGLGALPATFEVLPGALALRC